MVVFSAWGFEEFLPWVAVLLQPGVILCVFVGLLGFLTLYWR